MITTLASKIPQWMLPSVPVSRVVSITGSVYLVSSDSRISTMKNSFQAAKKAKRAAVMNPGRTRGRATRRLRQSPAPSTAMASQKSSGIDENEFWITKVANGSWNVVMTRITPMNELVKDRSFKTVNSGTISTWNGTMIAASMTTNTAREPRNANREKP